MRAVASPALLLAAALACGSARAAPTCLAPHDIPRGAIASPRWLARPVEPERFYPETRDLLAAGFCAVLDCRATARGTLTGCTVLSSDPPGAGGAALIMTHRFRMGRTDALGRRVAGRTVRVTVAFPTP